MPVDDPLQSDIIKATSFVNNMTGLPAEIKKEGKLILDRLVKNTLKKVNSCIE